MTYRIGGEAQGTVPIGTLGLTAESAKEALAKAEELQARGMKNVTIKTEDGPSYSPSEFRVIVESTDASSV